jgi:hypothetical protein
MVKKIILSENHSALVDDEDYEIVSKYKWRISKTNTYIYARSNKNDMSMHRLIMKRYHKLSDKIQIRHKNKNGLDNQKHNLLVCSISQVQHSTNTCKNMHGYRGVRQQKNGRYQAQIKVDRKTIALGAYDTIEEAARAYDTAARKYYGEYANLNFSPKEIT